MAKVYNENRNFECIPHELIFNSKLSDRARFVYIYMSAKPDGWDFVLKPMANELGYSVDTLRKYIKELIDAGWIDREGQHNENGKFGCVEYTIKSRPCRKNTNTVKTRHGKIPTQNINSSINTPLNNNISSINTPDKEEKENNIYFNEADGQMSFIPPSVDEKEKAFVAKMKERFPRIMKMKEPLTYKQSQRLKEDYSEELLLDVMERMENYPNLYKCGISANLTIRNWCRRSNERKSA